MNAIAEDAELGDRVLAAMKAENLGLAHSTWRKRGAPQREAVVQYRGATAESRIEAHLARIHDEYELGNLTASAKLALILGVAQEAL